MGQEQKGLWGWRAHGTVFRWQRFEPVCTCEVGPTSANKDTCLLFQRLGPQPRGEESPCPPGANRLERQTSTPMRNRRRSQTLRRNRGGGWERHPRRASRHRWHLTRSPRGQRRRAEPWGSHSRQKEHRSWQSRKRSALGTW